ncbi:hypothetical protein Pmar_PMAR012022, partial [Perkinsus marinus ATCC 50983]
QPRKSNISPIQTMSLKTISFTTCNRPSSSSCSTPLGINVLDDRAANLVGNLCWSEFLTVNFRANSTS